MRKVVKDPKGNYAVYSTDLDKFIALNLDEEQLFDFLVKEEVEDALQRVRSIIIKAKHADVKQWTEYLQHIIKTHSYEEYEKIMKDFTEGKKQL